MEKSRTLIVGAGLTGLFLTHRLAQAGHEVTLLEAREAVGGRYRRASSAQPFSSPGLDFFPAAPEVLDLLAWLKGVSPIPFHFEVNEHRPQIFDEGKWKPFAGFGESEFQSVSELSVLFGALSSVTPAPGLEQITRALAERLPVEAKTLSEVTSLQIENGRVTSVTVNGDKTLAADLVIFTPPPQALNDLIAGEALPAKHRTRLAKMQSWTALTLELEHSPALVDDSAVRFFASAAKDFEPVVGRVSGDVSKWMMLIPSERDGDAEYTGSCIRQIKRQLKRAWPLAFEGDASKGKERIYVQPNAFGQHSLKTKESYRFPEIPNLLLASPLLATLPGEIGAVEAVRTLESALLPEQAANQLPELSASC